MLDTLILVGAFCVLTNEPDTGFIAVSADSVVIQTALIQERSKAHWIYPNNVQTTSGIIITFKPADRLEIFDRQRFILAGFTSRP
jgi:hypothetical protein